MCSNMEPQFEAQPQGLAQAPPDPRRETHDPETRKDVFQRVDPL